MNKQDYVTEALKHLDSKDANGDDIYQKLPFDCTQKFVREVQQAVDLALSLIMSSMRVWQKCL